jgi:hypothetical protein
MILFIYCGAFEEKIDAVSGQGDYNYVEYQQYWRDEIRGDRRYFFVGSHTEFRAPTSVNKVGSAEFRFAVYSG